MSSTPNHTHPYPALPLVYSCSGCSDVAQLANTLAVRLDREQRAEMSCIAGVGGGVKPLLRTARSGRPIIAIDGCPLHCARHCLQQAGVEPTLHIDLSQAGIKKQQHQDFSTVEIQQVWDQVLLPTLTALPCEAISERPADEPAEQ